MPITSDNFEFAAVSATEPHSGKIWGFALSARLNQDLAAILIYRSLVVVFLRFIVAKKSIF
jgi:hypothetical protein